FCFLSMVLLLFAPLAQAQFAVIDVASVTQLVSEVQQLEQQLATARSQLAQAQAAFQSETGNRGMQALLAGTVRNDLPPGWSTVQSVVLGSGGAANAYPALAADLAQALNANSVLSAQQLTALPAAAGQSLQAGRRPAALLQSLTHQAL